MLNGKWVLAEGTWDDYGIWATVNNSVLRSGNEDIVGSYGSLYISGNIHDTIADDHVVSLANLAIEGNLTFIDSDTLIGSSRLNIVGHLLGFSEDSIAARGSFAGDIRWDQLNVCLRPRVEIVRSVRFVETV